MSKSSIWKIGLYTPVDKDKAECSMCKQNEEKKYTVSTKNGSTSSLISHLQTKHSDTEHYSKFTELEQSKKNLELKGSIEKFAKILTGSGLSAMDKKVVNWICCTLTSFHMLNHPTTRTLINGNNLLERIKDESHYRKNALPKAYQCLKDKVKTELNQSDFISFTTDIWTNANNSESFISLTSHFINSQWKRKMFILSICNFPGSHTAERIMEKIIALLFDWKIDTDKCHLFLRDGGSNYKKTFSDRNLNETHFQDANCAAHLLNLVVRDALTAPKVSSLLAKSRKIVAHFKHSSLACCQFKEIQLEQELPQHMLLQDMPVTWNAAYLMCEWLIEQRVAIEHYAYQKEQVELNLTEAEWDMLSELVILLEPLEELTKLFCDSPISVVYPYVQMIKEKIDMLEVVKRESLELKKSIIKGLEKRFAILLENRNFALAQFLDPRFKDRNVEATESFHKKVHEWLTKSDVDASLKSSSKIMVQSPPAKRTKSGLLDAFEESMSQRELPETSNFQGKGIRQEIAEYCSLQREPIRSNPLEFWRQNEKFYPQLAKEARRYLAAPSTSVASEELFSTARDVYSYRRMRIKPRKAEMVVFLNRNLPLFNYQ